ncbi:MAG TPA: biotin-dependent carboxyltransferase family protein [Synergistales bacterium]|nr:biotin-dependent carboxyltransferase family protein [Synergistales bacterium]HRV71312.1 biotin-dependent carboxyltransferase family protein [Thermovirgaceae bacterium]
MITIESPGLLTTVQDRGRWGYQAFGMPVSGVMDIYSLMAGNAVVCNEPGAAALEITLLGPSVRFGSSRMFCVTGGDLAPRLNGRDIPSWEGVVAREGDLLSFHGAIQGARAWLCISGGIDTPPVMGSRSTCLRAGIGGHQGRKLVAGDVIPLGRPDRLWYRGEGFSIPVHFRNKAEDCPAIRVIQGPQEEMISAAGLEAFYGSVFRVSPESDRMGYRLEGKRVEHAGGADIISDAIPLGAVQVPGHGSPIIMLADRQTTGGYPKIAVTIGADIPILAQISPGDPLSFRKADMAEAETALRSMSEHLYHVRDMAADWRSRYGKRMVPKREGNMILRIEGKGYDVSWEILE